MKAVDLLPWRERRRQRSRRRFGIALAAGVLGTVALVAHQALGLAAEVRTLRAAVAAEPARTPQPAEDTEPRLHPAWQAVREAYQRLARESGEDVTLSEWHLRIPVETDLGQEPHVVISGSARDGRAVGALLRRWQPPPGEGALAWDESPTAAGSARRFTLTIQPAQGEDHGEP